MKANLYLIPIGDYSKHIGNRRLRKRTDRLVAVRLNRECRRRLKLDGVSMTKEA